VAERAPRITQELADRLQAKLQAFYDALPADEKPAMHAIWQRVVPEVEVSGYAGGLKLTFSVMSPVGTDNRDGATRAASPGGQGTAGSRGQTPSVGIGIRF
jgi:hypothetical protein